MAEPYYGPDGTLYVWTGTGYHAIPKIAAGDVGVAQTQDEIWSQGDNPYLIQGKQEQYGVLDPAKYGLPNDYTNFSLRGGDQDAFNYLLKSGDKEGSQVSFTKDGDYYVPKYTGAEYWDTNDGKKSWIPLSIMLGGAAALYGGTTGMGAGLANSMTGAGGTALAGSEAAGIAAGTGYGAAGGAAGAAATAGSAALPYSASNLPTMWGPALSTVPGTVAGGATPWTASLGGLAGAGGFGSGLISTGASSLIPEGLRNVLDKIPPGLQSQLIKGGMTLAGGLLGQSGADGGGSVGSGGASGPRSIAPAITPTMYGGNNAPPTFQQQGNTETERRMTQQYLPGLFQQQGQQDGLLGSPLGAYSAQRFMQGPTGPTQKQTSLLGGMVPSAQQQTPGIVQEGQAKWAPGTDPQMNTNWNGLTPWLLREAVW